MDKIAQRISSTIGTGPDRLLRSDIRNAFAEFTSLKLTLRLAETPHSVLATTSNWLDQDEDNQWQATLGADTEHEWHLVATEDAQVDSNNSSKVSFELYQRPLNASEIEFMIRIEDIHGSDSSSHKCMGAILAIALTTTASRLESQNKLRQLAQSLSTHSFNILEFNHNLGSALFGSPHAPDDLFGGEDWSSDSEDDGDDVQPGQSLSRFSNNATPDGEEEGNARIINDTNSNSNNQHPTTAGRSGSAASSANGFSFFSSLFFPPAYSSEDRDTMVSPALRFIDPRSEERFSYWHAVHMFKFDFGSICLCIALQTILVFTKISKFSIATNIATWKWCVGYFHILTLLLLCLKSGRKLYIKHRDSFIIAIQALGLWYNHFLIRNYNDSGPPSLDGCNAVVYRFFWLPFMILVFQARFRWLAYTAIVSSAINMTLLKEMCTHCDGMEGTLRRCIGRGVSKVSLMVGAALCTVYCIEWRARRVWSVLQNRRND